MSEPKVLRYSDAELRDPVAIIGFPTVGLVGSILAGLMVREMNLPVVAGVTAADLPPYTFVTDGRPYPQIRIFGGTPPRIKRKKKTEGEEEQTEAPKEVPAPKKKRSKPRDLVIVTSEIAPKPEQTYDITLSIMSVLRDLGVNDIICLEGASGPGADAPVVGVAGNETADTLLKQTDVESMGDGIVRGISGIMLMEGTHEGFNVMSLLVPANPQLPDPRAAARLAGPIADMYPRFRVDTDPLYKEAEEIDARIRAQQAQQAMQGGGEGFYG